MPVLALAPPPLVCLDPGHGTVPAIGRQTEPIGPGSSRRKVKDGGGAPGEAPVALAIALKTRAILQRDGYRVAMTRTGPTYAGGNIDRARFCNVRHASLMLRIHADGSSDRSRHGVKTLYPALRRGWTDDIYASSLRAARAVQASVVRQTGARDLGLVRRPDLTGFNWANVPAILVETGLMTNPSEGRLLRSGPYQLKVARGLAAGAELFLVAPHPLDGLAAGLVHDAPARLGIFRCGLDLVDGRLRALELVPLLDDRARLRQLAPQLVRARVGSFDDLRAPAAEEAEQREPAEQPRQRPAHAAMLHWPPLPASSSRRVFPSGAGRRGRLRPKEGRSREIVVAYEILLMLDPDLPDGRQEEIVKRARELVERAKGKWVGHDVWGRRRLAYEIDHKGEGAYHLLNFDVEPETLDELSRILRITDGVMRHLAVRRIEGGAPGPPPPEPESVPEPAYAVANTRSQEEE